MLNGYNTILCLVLTRFVDFSWLRIFYGNASAFYLKFLNRS